MREELRRKLPKTRGWYTGSIVGILAIIGVVVWLVWRSMQAESPERSVKAAIEAAQAGDVAGVSALLTPESMVEPAAQTWAEQFSAALSRPGVAISDVDLLRDRANVKVGVPHRGSTGQMVTDQVCIKTARVGKAWLIDLPGTMATASPQFWQAIAAEAG